jgi:hypothetical protein
MSAPTVAERLAAGESVPLEDFTAADWHAVNPHFAEQWRDIQKAMAAQTLNPVQRLPDESGRAA